MGLAAADLQFDYELWRGTEWLAEAEFQVCQSAAAAKEIHTIDGKLSALSWDSQD